MQAVIQITPKLTFFDHMLQVPVCGSDDADVHLDCPIPADTLQLMFLNCTQKFRLQFERHFRRGGLNRANDWVELISLDFNAAAERRLKLSSIGLYLA